MGCVRGGVLVVVVGWTLGCNPAGPWTSSGSSGGGQGGSSSSSSSGTPCAAGGGCVQGRCCDGTCVAPDQDRNHCGACGNPCVTGQLCLSSSCLPATLASTCAARGALLLLDGLLVDDDAGNAIIAAMTAQCAPFDVVTGTIADTTYVSATTRLPVAGPQRLLVTVGGPYVNAVVQAYETNQTAPLYLDRQAAEDHRVVRVTGTQQPVVDVLDSRVTMRQDWFVVEVFVDASSDRMVLVAYGLGTMGTQAAAFFMHNVMMASLASQTSGYTVVQWTDSTSNGVDAADEFLVTATGG